MGNSKLSIPEKRKAPLRPRALDSSLMSHRARSDGASVGGRS
jgi:hypothetical protein